LFFLLGGLAAAMLALPGACGGGDDEGDTAGCTLERCFSYCIGAGLPGGDCIEGMCVCSPPGSDGDGDADGDGEAGDADGREDYREDARPEGEVREDGEVPEGGEVRDDADVRDEAIREDAGPTCLSIATGWTFNAGAGDWVHKPVGGPTEGSFDPWEVGVPEGGPESCRTGGETDLCWGTDLDGSYSTCQTAELRSPTLDLSPCATSTFDTDIMFWQWYDFAAGTDSTDGGTIEVSSDDGDTWVQIAPLESWDGPVDMDLSGGDCEEGVYVDGLDGFVGSTGGRWVQRTVRVPADHRTTTFSFRFVFGSDGRTSGEGWFIDDVSLVVH
jgi:hypothetical protein